MPSLRIPLWNFWRVLNAGRTCRALFIGLWRSAGATGRAGQSTPSGEWRDATIHHWRRHHRIRRSARSGRLFREQGSRMAADHRDSLLASDLRSVFVGSPPRGSYELDCPARHVRTLDSAGGGRTHDLAAAAVVLMAA